MFSSNKNNYFLLKNLTLFIVYYNIKILILTYRKEKVLHKQSSLTWTFYALGQVRVKSSEHCSVVDNMAMDLPCTHPLYTLLTLPRVSDLDTKSVRLAPNGTNPELFQIKFQNILAPCAGAKMF